MKKNFPAKFWKVMRVCAVQAIVAITLCGVALSHPNYAQLLDKEITINISDVPFENALQEIESVAQVKFAYSMDQLEGEPRVSLSIERRSLAYLFEGLFTARKIQYKVHEKDAVITLKKRLPTREEERSSFQNSTRLDERTEPLIRITGRVTESSTSAAMPGVNILVKGTTNGTATDADGNYTLAAEESDVLVFSFIGYTSVEVPVNGRAIIDVVMTPDALNLGEVVVNAGYWEVKERERTGNISRLSAEEMGRQTVTNPLQALQGRMPGVYIQQNTGLAGGGFDILIRGQNSLRDGKSGTINGNLPLYLIDGVPFTSSSLTSSALSGSNLRGGNPLSLINPRDIESIEILKDADATAIYGSRGANGVVLITTKKGDAGQPRVTVDVSRGLGQVPGRMDLLNTEQYQAMRREAIENDGNGSLLEDPQYDIYFPDLKLWDTNRYTDWQNELIGGTSSIFNAQLSASGGSARTKFLLGGNYYKESTVFPGKNAFYRGSGRATLSHLSEDDRFHASASFTYGSTMNDIPNADLTALAISLPPNGPALYDVNGALNWENDTWLNPVSSLKRKYRSDIENFVGNARLSYEVYKGLHIKASFGYTSMFVNEISTTPLASLSPQVIGWGVMGSSKFGDSYMKTWITEPQASYTREIGKGSFNVLFGATLQSTVQSGKTIEANGYTNDAFLENIDAATSINIANASYSQYKYAAVFGRLNYTLANRYIINVTGRRDGSSRFGPGKQFANFGALGLAWIFTEENWLDRLSFLTFGKLRASYGSSGSDAIGNYEYLDTYSATRYPYNNSSAVALTRLANPDYSWEVNRKFEAAIDLSLWQHKLDVSLSYYQNRSSGQLVGFPLPVMTGQSSVQFNLPAVVENTGWEAQLSSMLLNKRAFQWITDLNFTLPSNVLLEFPDIEKFPVYLNRFDVGRPVFILKGFEYTGVDPQSGLYSFADRDDDGTVTRPVDVIGISSVTQELFGGLNNSFRFKGFEVDILVQFVKQTGYSYESSFTFPGDMSNQPVEVMSRWRQPGDNTSIQRFTAFDPNGEVLQAFSKHRSSDHAITDASFIRFKNVSISWTFPQQWLEIIHLHSCKAYVQGQNLMTRTSYIGLDPENQTSQSLPPLRVMTAGLMITL